MYGNGIVFEESGNKASLSRLLCEDNWTLVRDEVVHRNKKLSDALALVLACNKSVCSAFAKLKEADSLFTSSVDLIICNLQGP